MARSRSLKPSLFKNEILGEADPLLTIVFVGLWCLADREGRLEDRPKRIKAEILPYRETPCFNRYLTDLERLGFIARYKVGDQALIQVINFVKHQSPHKTEKPSELPAQTEESMSCEVTDEAPLSNGAITVKESPLTDSLFTDSLCRGAPPKSSGKFHPPTPDEVRAYVTERGYEVDPQRFCDHYEAKGWLIGKTKMKSWQAAVRTWASRDNESAPSAPARYIR